jgi:hypothetical protein
MLPNEVRVYFDNSVSAIEDWFGDDFAGLNTVDYVSATNFQINLEGDSRQSFLFNNYGHIWKMSVVRTAPDSVQFEGNEIATREDLHNIPWSRWVELPYNLAEGTGGYFTVSYDRVFNDIKVQGHIYLPPGSINWFHFVRFGDFPGIDNPQPQTVSMWGYYDAPDIGNVELDYINGEVRLIGPSLNIHIESFGYNDGQGNEIKVQLSEKDPIPFHLNMYIDNTFKE